MFRHVAGAIKSGSLNPEQSYKRRSLESYLIERSRWLAEREQLLERSGISGFKDPAPVLEELDAALQSQFEDTNRAIAEGKNPHFKMQAGKLSGSQPRNRMRRKASRSVSSFQNGTVCR